MPARENSPLDPLALTRDLVALESAALLAQARALVLERQEDAGAYISDPVLAVHTLDGQQELRGDVEYYLNRLMPDAIARLTDATGAANLLAALDTASAAADGSTLPGLLDAALTRFEDCRRGAAGLAANLDQAATTVSGRKDALQALLQQQIEALQGPDGQIQQTRDAIAQTRKALSDDLDNVVVGANEIGKGVTTFLTDKIKLVTGIFSTFGGQAKPDAGGEGDGGGSGGQDAPKKFEAEDIDLEQTSDEGSGEASKGSTQVGQAVASFHTHNRELADLYRALAEQKAELAVAALVEDQADAFCRALQNTAGAAAAVAATWQSVLENAQTLRESDPEKLPDALAGALSDATGRWSSLTAELGHVRAALTGQRGAIPSVGALPSAG